MSGLRQPAPPGTTRADHPVIRFRVATFLHVTFRIRGAKQSKIHAERSGFENYLPFQYIRLQLSPRPRLVPLCELVAPNWATCVKAAGDRDDLFNRLLIWHEAARRPRWAQWSC